MKPAPFFYTPESMEEMQDILEALPPQQRSTVYPYVMMMYNLLIDKLVTKDTK